MGLHIVGPQQAGGPETKESRHDIEGPDDQHGPNHTGPGRFRVRHRVKSDQNVRQAGGTEQQRHPQGDLVPGILEDQSGMQEVTGHRLPVRSSGRDRRQRGKEVPQIKMELLQYEIAEKNAPTDQ